MIGKLKSSFICLTLIGLISCGPSKKLQSANQQISELQNTVSANEKVISGLKEENVQYGKEAEDCRKAKEVISQKLEKFQNNLAAQGGSMEKIQAKVESALKKFQDAGATVTYKRGLVHVNFENSFFFKEGSSIIGPKGREGLNTIAEVLRENPKVNCIIIGNTAADPDSEGSEAPGDNWSLSTERANSVVRILHNVYNINPNRLTAAGRGEYSPIAGNTTEEDRMKNRRVEIVLDPDLSRIWDMMK